MPHDIPQTDEEANVLTSWSILPKDSYPHPHQDGPSARTFSYAATVSTVHNLASEVIYFLARGSGFSGVLSVQDDGEQGTGMMHVDVTMYYTHAHLAEGAQVHKEARQGRSGLNILTPRESRYGEEMFFDVMVHLPPGVSQPQWIPRFETDLPQFSHLIGQLATTVHFGQLLLRGANAQIVSKSIHAENVSMGTSNARIDCGSVSAGSLVLETANGLINANAISLFSAGNEAGSLNMDTSNGQITAAISLVSTSERSTDGIFNVSARTSNGAISMSFPHTPISSLQYINTETSNAPVSVELDQAFEGEFSLQTSNARALLQRHASVRNPSGWGSTRNVELAQGSPAAVRGTATWGVPPPWKTMGRAVLVTSNSPARLTV